MELDIFITCPVPSQYRQKAVRSPSETLGCGYAKRREKGQSVILHTSDPLPRRRLSPPPTRFAPHRSGSAVPLLNLRYGSGTAGVGGLDSWISDLIFQDVLIQRDDRREPATHRANDTKSRGLVEKLGSGAGCKCMMRPA